MDFPGFNSLMQTLQGVSDALSSGDNFDLLQYISQLSTELAIAQEDFLATIHLPHVISVLIQCLHKSELPDIPFYSMSCLASLVDSLPHASGIIVSSGGIQALSAKLLNFEFIDQAENSIKVFEKISLEHAPSIVAEGAFEAMIQTMDFFESNVQKRILNIAINVGKTFTTRETLDKILVLLPNFVRLSEFQGIENVNQNEKCIDFFIVTAENLMRLVGPGEESKAFFNHLKELQLVRNLLGLMSQSSQLILKSLKLLRTLTRSSSDLCNEFLSMGGSDVIKEVLSRPFENPSLANETLRLVSSVLPSKTSSNLEESKKLKIYSDRPQFLRSITEMIFPRAIGMYEELLNPESKTAVIEILDKTIQLSEENDIKPFVSSPSFSSFLSEVLASKDFRMVEHALKIVNTLSDRMFDSVNTNFIREGVVHRVNALKDLKGFKNFKPLKDPLLDFDPVFRRCLSNESEPSGRLIFEEILSKIRSRALDLNEPPPSLFFQSSHDSKLEYQQNLINLSKTFLDKQKGTEGKSAFSKELGKFVKLIEGSDSAVQAFIKITKRLATGQRYSSFEVCSSKLPEVLFNWMTDSKVTSEVLLKRLYDFLAIFSKPSPTGETFLEILINVIIGALQYTQNFTVSVTSLPAFSYRRMNQRVRLHFLYSPEGDPGHEMIEKHELFSACAQFNMTVGQFTTFEVLKNAILSAKSSRDLSNMRDLLSFPRDHRMELLGEYSDDDYDDYLEDLHLKPVEDSRFSLVFSINSQKIELSSTIADVFASLKLLDSPQIKFALVMKIGSHVTSEFLTNTQSIYSYIIAESTKLSLDSKYKVLPYLSLLKLLFLTNDFLQNFSSGLQSACLSKLLLPVFKSAKLGSLLSRQVQEQNMFLHNINPKMLQESIPTIPSLPSWVLSLPKACRFLFPYSIREQYLHSFCIKVPQCKTKARANRSSLLEKAVSIMSDSRLLKQGQLEIDYENEVGTGIGPSLEFFSLVSVEIRKLRLWRSSDETGLFPMPVKACSGGWKENFNFIGRFVGKALADKRQIDLNFSPVFWKLVLGQPVTLFDMSKVDKSLGQILVDFNNLLSQRPKRTKLLYKDSSIESLNLSFILPGYEKIELKSGGKNCLVTGENLEEYLKLVTAATLLQTAQAEAFRQGLEVLMPVSTLELFTGEEMEDLLCGQTGSPWKMEELQQNIHPAHGFTANSPVFNNLLIIMSEFSLNEQRKFLQFLTGSPRLPFGGFAALNPKLTVVRKDPSIQGMHPDEYLPSVMTCQNYLKIPEYSSFEILQRNLKYAVQEGHESFYLS
jgi:hypothetical protein